MPSIAAFAAVGLLVPGMLAAPKPTQAMPEFAQATGLSCSACHTIVPLLNAYGRYVQSTGYATIDRHALAKTRPVWIEESLVYDSTAGALTGTPRYHLHAAPAALPARLMARGAMRRAHRRRRVSPTDSSKQHS